jgi:hypothetical protein
MKLNTSRKVIALALFLIPITCSIILSATLSIASANDNFNDYVVGGTIIPTNNLLAPWIGAITILALIVAAAYWRGKNVSSM